MDIVMYSGGVGSYHAAKRTIAKGRNVALLFTDTLIEDGDLYRFLIESAGLLFGVTVDDLVERARAIPEVFDDLQGRKSYLSRLSDDTARRIPRLHWVSDGRTPWELFLDERFIGNDKVPICSRVLKQEMARAAVEKRFKKTDKIVLGIDWQEQHRKAAPKAGWYPHPVVFPMMEKPYLTKVDMLNNLDGMRAPALYRQGFPHNNCGGFCVRGGFGLFARLYDKNPVLYMYHEGQERQVRSALSADISVLRSRKGYQAVPLTLEELRERMDGVDRNDMGGCGCFVD